MPSLTVDIRITLAYDMDKMGILDGLKVIVNPPKASGQKNETSTSPSLKKVLIVEDEKVLADALQIRFQNEGFEVFIAGNGEEALQMAVTEKPDVLLLDLVLPIMDGKTMLRQLRQMPQFANLPVIVLTNAGGLDNIKEMKTYYRVSDFLIKASVSTDEIVLKVKTLLK